MTSDQTSAEMPEAVGVFRALRIVLAFPFFFLAVTFCVLAMLVEYHDSRETLAKWIKRRLQ